eukprot:CAMPEP_0184708444 /NCGR_PEP_ID=MMETSP0313-20130426/37779_1 /TAXON_ID=2792 /ORGANISM="Porphyridium aerugineum, Strain SAG 1380-2" /LENGTH=51 /DNA_ID=CAMNT_0027170033 /DNA_START=694 /DNA_END=846 /DNA_ORIENTATION=+
MVAGPNGNPGASPGIINGAGKGTPEPPGRKGGNPAAFIMGGGNPIGKTGGT